MNDTFARFDAAARARVNQAIEAAESKTLAEILPVVSRISGSYDRAEDIVGIWVGATAVGLAWYFFQGVESDVGWAGASTVRLGFWFLLLLFIVGFVAGVVVSDRYLWVRRLFVPTADLEQRTIQQAKTVFFDRRVYRTTRATGLLIYVSIFERRVVVLADDAVADKLSERALGEVRDEILDGLRADDLAGGLVAGIERVGNLLGGTLPAGEERIDEVTSEVVVIG